MHFVDSTVPVTKPRVLFINRSYWPDAEATGQLLTDLCESLVDRFEVSVLCGQPNSNPANAEFVRAGMQRHAGVIVHRLEHTHFNKRNGGGRIANLLSFTLAVRKWLAKSAHYDMVVSETDPFLLPLVVAPYAARTDASFVAYLQDIYPDIAIRLGKAKDGWVTRQLRKRLLAAYQTAKKIVVLSPAMGSVLEAWGLDAKTIAVVPNWVNCDAVRSIKQDNPFRQANHWQDDFIVMHSGNMGLSQRLDALITAVDQPLFPANAKVVLIGGGADEIRLRQLAAKSKRAEDIHFLPYQSRESLSESLSAADLHVISVDPRIGGTMMPSKLYGILASATPVVVIADADTDVAKLVAQHQIGAVCNSHDPAKIAAAVAKMTQLPPSGRQAMQNRSRHLATTQFDKCICVDQFKSVLQQVLLLADSSLPKPLADIAGDLVSSTSSTEH